MVAGLVERAAVGQGVLRDGAHRRHLVRLSLAPVPEHADPLPGPDAEQLGEEPETLGGRVDMAGDHSGPERVTEPGAAIPPTEPVDVLGHLQLAVDGDHRHHGSPLPVRQDQDDRSVAVHLRRCRLPLPGGGRR